MKSIATLLMITSFLFACNQHGQNIPLDSIQGSWKVEKIESVNEVVDELFYIGLLYLFQTEKVEELEFTGQQIILRNENGVEIDRSACIEEAHDGHLFVTGEEGGKSWKVNRLDGGVIILSEGPMRITLSKK